MPKRIPGGNERFTFFVNEKGTPKGVLFFIDKTERILYNNNR